MEDGILKYEVYWQRDSEEPKYHGSYSTSEKAYKSILDWWQINEFEPPYVRSWHIDNVEHIDYGNHSCFYSIKEVRQSDS